MVGEAESKGTEGGSFPLPGSTGSKHCRLKAARWPHQVWETRCSDPLLPFYSFPLRQEPSHHDTASASDPFLPHRLFASSFSLFGGEEVVKKWFLLLLKRKLQKTLFWKAIFELLETPIYKTSGKNVLWKLQHIIQKLFLVKEPSYNLFNPKMEQNWVGRERQNVLRGKTGDLTSVSVLPQTHCVAFRSFLGHSRLQIPHLEGGNNAYFSDSFDNQMS